MNIFVFCCTVFTAHVRSTTGGYIFSLSATGARGGGFLVFGPRSFPGEGKAKREGSLTSTGTGYPFAPQPGSGQVTPSPPSQDQDRVPPYPTPTMPDQEMPWGGYDAGGTPLAFSRRSTSLLDKFQKKRRKE